MTLPTPHGDKLQALLRNDKLPNGDRKLIEKAIARYQAWLNKLAGVSGDDHCVNAAVAPLNEYRTFLALEVVFDGGDDFLYRRKGRLKLDNTVSEEFPPRLVARVFPQLAEGFSVGPHSCFAALYFTSAIGTAANGDGFIGEPIHSGWAYNPEAQWAVLVAAHRPDPDRWIDWRIRRKR